MKICCPKSMINANKAFVDQLDYLRLPSLVDVCNVHLSSDWLQTINSSLDWSLDYNDM